MSILFPVEPLDEESRLQLLYDRLAARLSLGAARIRLSRRKLTGGEIRYGRPHVITISAHLSEAERRDTLLHEAAHAWAFRVRGVRGGHGPIFQRLARRLGVKNGHAPVTPALTAFRARRQVLYRCEGCRQIFRRLRPFRGAWDCIACLRAGRPSRLRREP
jgi:predicted SprT family Zn-dependent metalloprotease